LEISGLNFTRLSALNVVNAFWDVDEQYNFGGQKVKGQGQRMMNVTKPLARLLEPLRIATILNIYLSNGM